MKMSKFSLTKSALVVCGLAAGMATPIARAEGIPGMRGHDHTGVTVPDMAQAVDFFVNVVGCQKAMSFGPFSDDKGTFMQDLLNVHPRAVIEEITLVRCGHGSNIELFKYSSPDQTDATPKNSDIGGYHIAFYVEDIKAAKDYLEFEGREDVHGSAPGRARSGRRPEHLLFPGALGSATRGDLLPDRDGLREGRRTGSLVAKGSGEVGSPPLSSVILGGA